MEIYGYNDWAIWKKGVEITREVCCIGDLLPDNHSWELRSEISKSGVSISSSLMEGTCGNDRTSFNRCLVMALGSAYECKTHLLIVKRDRLIEENIIEYSLEKINEFERMINGMIIYYHCQNRLIRGYLNRPYN